jgi:hypothetical protein
VRDFIEMGFKKCHANASVFVHINANGTIIVPVSTDDMNIAGSSRKLIDGFKGDLQQCVKITDLGPVH